MAQVEKALLGHLEGVSHVSAGFISDSAIVSVKDSVVLDIEKVNAALKTTKFSCVSLKKVTAEN